MSAATALPEQPLQDLTAALCDFVVAAEHYKKQQTDRLSAWAKDLAERFAAHAAASPRFAAASQRLRAFSTELATRGTSSPRLKALWLELSDDYEAMFAQARKLRLSPEVEARLVHVKPRNLARNLFHVSNGLLAVGLYELVWGKTGMLIFGGTILASFIAMDLGRRLSPRFNALLVDSLFGKISRPGEAYKIPSATHYLAALLLGVVILPQRAIELGALVLAFGDPVASLAGKAWGSLKLWRDRSLVGSVAFVAASTAVCAAFLLLVGTPLPRALSVAFAVSVAGAVAELFSVKVDDNFTIPLLAGGVAALLL